MKKIGFLGMVFFLAFLMTEGVSAQRFLNKLKDKTEDKIIDNIFKDKENQEQSNQNNQNQNNTSGTQNTRSFCRLQFALQYPAGNVRRGT